MADNSSHKSFLVPDKSYSGKVKREIGGMLESSDFNSHEIGKLNIIVSELVSNLGKYAKAGQEILVKILCENNKVIGVEILSLDTAPGMNNPLRMLEDGVSTSGTLGQGLGAIKRLSDEFDIYSAPGKGTIVLSRFYKKDFKKTADNISLDINAVMVPLKGEIACGDGWSVKQAKGKWLILTMDGLGHGPDAQAATDKAIGVFQNTGETLPNEIMRKIHSALKESRGAVGSVTSIDIKNELLLYCGVGNITGRIISRDETKSLMSYNGTLGYGLPHTFDNLQFKWGAQKILILYSDGLKVRTDLLQYIDWQKYDSSLIAASLYKDNTRRTDDSLAITCRSIRA